MKGYRLKVSEAGPGLHPSEVLVRIHTDEGDRTLIVHPRSLRAGTICIGYPVGRRGDDLLVELPRELADGSWRVWVSPDQLVSRLET